MNYTQNFTVARTNNRDGRAPNKPLRQGTENDPEIACTHRTKWPLLLDIFVAIN